MTLEEARRMLADATDAYNRGDFDAFVRHISPDVVWQDADEGFPGLEHAYVGHDGVRRWWDAVREPWEAVSLTVADVELEGNKVLVHCRLTARGAGSGVPVEMEFFDLCTLAGRQLVAREPYFDRDRAQDALRAARGRG